MITTYQQQDLTSKIVCSDSIKKNSNQQWSDVYSESSFNASLLLSTHKTVWKSKPRSTFLLVPPAWSPLIPQVLPQARLRDLCLPRQEPRAPGNILNRSSLISCSPSLAKFSRTTSGQHLSISTSTTTLLPANHLNNFRHPAIDYLAVNERKFHNHSTHLSHQTR